MNDYPCLKVSQVIPLVEKMEKIKIIIGDCVKHRYGKIENIGINEIQKKNYTKELDKRLTLTKNKYVLLHGKLYDILDEIVKCECCSSLEHICRGDVFCLKQEDNKKLWEEMDGLFNKIINFYEEVENGLVLELELCLHRINKIRKVKFFD